MLTVRSMQDLRTIRDLEINSGGTIYGTIRKSNLHIFLCIWIKICAPNQLVVTSDRFLRNVTATEGC